MKTDVLPESRDIHCLVVNFGVHGLGELTLIQKKTEGISKLHVIYDFSDEYLYIVIVSYWFISLPLLALIVSIIYYMEIIFSYIFFFTSED